KRTDRILLQVQASGHLLPMRSPDYFRLKIIDLSSSTALLANTRINHDNLIDDRKGRPLRRIEIVAVPPINAPAGQLAIVNSDKLREFIGPEYRAGHIDEIREPHIRAARARDGMRNPSIRAECRLRDPKVMPNGNLEQPLDLRRTH